MSNIFDDVPEIAAPEASAASPLWDVLRSVGGGLRRGVEGLAGIGGDLPQLGNMAVEGVRTRVLGLEPNPDWNAPVDMSDVPYAFRSEVPRAPTSQMIREGVTDPLVGKGYQPQTTGGEYASTISEFLPAATLGGGGLMRNLITQGVAPGVVSETAGQATKGTENEPLARTLGALAGGLGAGAAAGRPVAQTAQQTERAGIVDAARRQNIHLPAAAMPDAPITSYTAGKLGQIPALGAPLRASADRTITGMGNRMEEIAGNQGNSNFRNAIEDTREALHDWQTGGTGPARQGTSRRQIEDAYADVENIISARYPTGPRGGRPQGVPPTTPLANTRQMHRDIIADMDEDTTRSARDALGRVEDAIGRPQGLTYGGVKRLRSEIGLLQNDKNLPDVTKAAYGRLYGSLTEDLRMAVYNTGGAPALRAWEHANNLTRDLKGRQEQIAKIIGLKQGAGLNSSENIANRMLNMASSRSTGHLDRLREARRAVTESGGADVWNNLGAALIQRLGRDPSSAQNVFSPERFLTAMGKFEPDAARILFGRNTYEQLQDLRTIAEAHRALMRHGNPSGTGGVVTGMSIASSVLTAPMTAVATIGGVWAASAILARPASRRALINWARARNGYIEARTPARLNALSQAAEQFAPYLAMESGRDKAGVARELMGEKPAAVGDIFGDVEAVQ